MTNNYTGHWKQSKFQEGTGGSQKEDMMQRHVVSSQLTALLIVGGGGASALPSWLLAKVWILWRPEAGSLEKGAICLGTSECATEDVSVVRCWVSNSEEEQAAAYKGLVLTLLSFQCVSCTVHLQLGINNRSRTQDFAHYFNFVNSEFLSRSALEGLALLSG